MTRHQYFEQPSFIPIFDDYSYFAGKCIGITGQRGVLGGILSQRFAAHHIKLEAYPSDITDLTTLHEWFKKHHFDYLFHFAAIVPVVQVTQDPLKAYRVNVIGSYNISHQVIETQPHCWLFLASSSHVYKGSQISGEELLKVGSAEEPESFYGTTKLMAERISRPILEHCKMNYCIGRIFSFSSTTQKEPYLIPTLSRRIAELAPDENLEIINPDSVRDIMDADTVIDSVLHLAKERYQGTLNIGSGHGMSVKELTIHLMKLLGKTNEILGVNKSQPNALVADINPLKQAIADKNIL